MLKPKKRAKKRRVVKLSQLCTVCGDLGRLVAGVRPRTCDYCFTWPPAEGENRRPAPKKKGKRERG